MSIRLAVSNAPTTTVFAHPPVPKTPLVAQLSYAGPPAYAAAPMYQMPQAPQTRSVDLPDPAAVERQKVQYQASLQQQLETGTRAIIAEQQQRKIQLAQAAEHAKATFFLNMDRQLKIDEMNADQESNQRILELTKMAHHQHFNLQSQAAQLTSEYCNQRTAEQHSVHRGAIDQTFHQESSKLHAQTQSQLAAAQQIGVPVNHPQGQYPMMAAPAVQQARPAATMPMVAAPSMVAATPNYGAPATYAMPPQAASMITTGMPYRSVSTAYVAAPQATGYMSR